MVYTPLILSEHQQVFWGSVHFPFPARSDRPGPTGPARRGRGHPDPWASRPPRLAPATRRGEGSAGTVQQKTVNSMKEHNLCNKTCPRHSLVLFYTGFTFLGKSFTYAAFVSLKEGNSKDMCWVRGKGHHRELWVVFQSGESPGEKEPH